MAEEELFEARLRKVEEWRRRGVDPWPPRFERSHVAAELHREFADLPPGGSSGRQVSVAGRLVSSRVQGALAFGDVIDRSGKIQLFVMAPGVEAFDELDVGDIVGAAGEVVRTKRGELSVRTDDVVLLSKALRSPPAKWHGLHDVETRYRRRYLDLMANEEARRIAALRPEVLKAVRAFYDVRGFVEVETPVLHPIPGGGAALPFVTHYNVIDRDVYLRVALELYLKRLVVGGMERVYEIGRVFRNEGMDYKHSPESTMLESYEAYADYFDIMAFVGELVREVAKETVSSTEVTFRGVRLDLGAEWRRVRLYDLVSEVVGETVTPDTPLDRLRELAGRFGVEVEPWWPAGMVVGQLYDKVAEPTVEGPLVVYDYPIEISPLARTHRDDPRLVERFEVVVCGMELCNAFSELTDPLEQRRRLEEQQRARERGDLEAHPIDEPFLEALEYGMPPTGGLGVGLDRLVMVLSGASSIREVILFPALRPQAADTPREEDE